MNLRLRSGIIAVAVVILDRLSKLYISRAYAPWDVTVVIPRVFNIVHGDGINPRQSKQIAREDSVFIHCLIARRGEPPVRDEFRAAEKTQNRICVSHVQRQKH